MLGGEEEIRKLTQWRRFVSLQQQQICHIYRTINIKKVIINEKKKNGKEKRTTKYIFMYLLYMCKLTHANKIIKIWEIAVYRFVES